VAVIPAGGWEGEAEATVADPEGTSASAGDEEKERKKEYEQSCLYIRQLSNYCPFSVHFLWVFF
jgi:hypothetical protein